MADVFRSSHGCNFMKCLLSISSQLIVSTGQPQNTGTDCFQVMFPLFECRSIFFLVPVIFSRLSSISIVLFGQVQSLFFSVPYRFNS